MTSENLGHIDSTSDRTTLRYTRQLRHAPDKVWRALTESEHMRSWLPVDIIGARATNNTVELRFWPDLAAKHGLDRDAGQGTIRVWNPPSVFEWTWHDSIIRFELRRTEGGSELTLIVDVGTIDPEIIIDNAAGYQLWMDHITRLLDTGSSPSIATADPLPIEAQYRLLLNEDHL